MEEFYEYLKFINNCDADSPLLSTTKLGKKLDDILLQAVDRSDLIELTQALNVEQLIPTEDGLARDYRGLAELMGFSGIQTESCFKRSPNPTQCLIDAFINLSITRNDRKPVTLNNLVAFLERIERFDVIDDFMKTLIELVSSTSNDSSLHLASKPKALKDNEESTLVYHPRDDQLVVVKKFDQLTVDDQPNSAIIYDAFICFAPEDMKYTQQLIAILESAGKRIATVDDILPGHFEHDALIRLIDERCRKLITVLTPNFLRSKECEFQTKFASEVGLKADCRKIIPVLFEACDDSKLPSMIKVLTKIDMTVYGSHPWQIKRLINSLGGDEPASRLSRFPITNHNQTTILSRTLEHNSYNTDFHHQQQSVASTSESCREPIVDLLHSQNSTNLASSAAGSSTTLRSCNPSPNFERTSNRQSISSNKVAPTNWLKANFWTPVKRRVLGSSSSINDPFTVSSSSQALLITSNSPDFLDDRNSRDINGS